MIGLTVKDLEKLQSQCPDYQMELVNGAIVVRSPSVYESDEVAFEFGRQLANWTKPRKHGDVLQLPDLFPGWEVQIAELWLPVFDEE